MYTPLGRDQACHGVSVGRRRLTEVLRVACATWTDAQLGETLACMQQQSGQAGDGASRRLWIHHRSHLSNHASVTRVLQFRTDGTGEARAWHARAERSIDERAQRDVQRSIAKPCVGPGQRRIHALPEAQDNRQQRLAVCQLPRAAPVLAGPRRRCTSGAWWAQGSPAEGRGATLGSRA